MDGTITIGTEIDSKSFEAQIAKLEDELETMTEEYEDVLKSGTLDDTELKKFASDIEQTKNKIISLRKQQEALGNTKFFDGISNSLNKVIKKVGKWALAVFGVRSAYMAVRRAASTISQYNEQIATDLSYIQYAIATTLEPVVKALVNMAYNLLATINSISMELFNYNLFLNASVKNFNKMNKGASALKKTLSGFDEMNVLQDTSTGAGGGTPSIDLSQITQEEEGNKFISFWKRIIKFWEEDWKTVFDGVAGNWQSFVDGIMITLKGLYDFIKGFLEMIWGIIKVFISLFTGDINTFTEGIKLIIKGAKDFILGILEIIGGVVVAVLGFIKGIFLDLWDGIVAGAEWVWNGIKSVFATAANWFNNNVIKPISKFFSGLWTGIKNDAKAAFDGLVTIIKAPLNLIIDGLNALIKGINKISFDVPDWVPIIGGEKFGFDIPSIPRLARGGIVNNPGSGVMMGNYIAGERGAEAVLPLTDDTLQRLANMIPITVNVTNTMNGRVISRELQKVQNESDFAFNR